MDSEVPQLSFSETGYDRDVVERVWALAQAVPGNDPAVWRKDEHGAWLHRQDYRNRRSSYGWEIADLGPHARRSGLASLRPLQWQNHVDYLVATRTSAVITADGLANVRKLL